MRKMKRIISLWLAVILVITGVDLPFGILEIQAAANVKRYTVLVLDTSDTAEFTYNNETIYTADTALSDVKSAAGKFIRDISATGGDNYVAVISYKDYATTVSGFSKEYSSLINKINNLSASSTTRDISSGLELANSMLNHADSENVIEIIYVFLSIFLYLLKCPQSLILSALRAFCFCGKPHISRSIFLYFPYQSWLKSW